MPNTVSFNENYPDIAKSDELYARAQKIMTPVTQTLAKGPGQYTKGVSPKYVKRAKGSHIWDVDGNEYIDFQMGIGPISLGYAYPKVDDAIRAQLEDGITFSMMHELEVELSELIHEIIPNAASIRISKTGADVCSAAVRVSRAFTGRDNVLCCGYHGWHDWYIGTTSRDKGIPQESKDLVAAFEYNNIDSLKALLDENVACVILEPFIFDAPKDDFLHEVARLCKENGTLLIFDEMWTGFRVAVGGAQEYFGITPDLAVYSKAFANGMPIALLTGRRDVMQLFEQDVFFFTTFGGEALSLAAAVATISEMREKNVPARLAEQGKKLKDGYNDIAAELGISQYTKCYGYDCRTIVTFDPSAGNGMEIKAFVQQELFKRGIMWGGFHNMCFSHTDADVAHTLAAYREVLPLLKEAIEAGDVASRLLGEPVEAVFRKVTNAAPVKAK
ncbi:aminotransferase class III-fold pyridoxal phosphate-dependent enzyme [Hymenobacter negativus]|uniref:Aminotransferase class III-fold pyridoxal phosphate-dependent enzyme n=1 Tax=Hymenobacter negativus TaxID=2795026 RepID=A0ABS0Q8X2_9BACT|nr:aminotransferase class III-fold pyridoxal phosphate-dependent enzyme [Hymenobacter negativus]MBH8558912.1 aminotransferase class III-fold pyridoxal phosphate-dependent enzyme [Hymenobacter negativus]